MHLKVIIIIFCYLAGEVISDSIFKDVNTKQGVVRGYNSDDEDVFSFFGIPYATAPRGVDLFKESLPPPTWSDVFNATDRYTICPQMHTISDDYVPLQRSIDCLNVNIFVPNTTQHDLPVLFFIHGGAYMYGYGMQMTPIPMVKKGLIVINFNYRVGAHGFLCLGTEFAPGNAGLKDQVNALRWVRDNISNFGGDPDKITIAGSSAGSGAVELHLLSNLSNGLFNQAICDSGSTLGYHAIAHEPLKTAEELANFFGVYSDQNTAILETFYSLMNEEQLSAEHSVEFFPCVEDHNLTDFETFLGDSPRHIINNGLESKVPLLTGFTTTEGLVVLSSFESQKPGMEVNFADYLPKDIQYDNYTELENIAGKVKDFYFPTGEITEEGFIYYYTDTYFNYPQYMFARLHSRSVSSVYLYYFTFNGTVKLADALPTSEGVGHTAQTMYVHNFDVPWVYENMTGDDYIVQEHLRDFYFNFCNVGNPSTSLTWLPFSEEHTNYMEINVPPTIQELPSQESIQLWDSIYKYDIQENISGSVVLSGNLVVQILSVFLVALYYLEY